MTSLKRLNKIEKKYLIAEWKKYWKSYPEPKPERHLFYNRMNNLEKPKEYCIQVMLPWTNYEDRYEKMKKTLEERKQRAKTNHKIEQEKLYKAEYYWIGITYPLVEERINIYQAYKRQIEDLQDKLDNADSLTPNEVLHKWSKELEQLEKELADFRLLNPLM